MQFRVIQNAIPLKRVANATLLTTCIYLDDKVISKAGCGKIYLIIMNCYLYVFPCFSVQEHQIFFSVCSLVILPINGRHVFRSPFHRNFSITTVSSTDWNFCHAHTFFKDARTNFKGELTGGWNSNKNDPVLQMWKRNNDLNPAQQQLYMFLEEPHPIWNMIIFTLALTTRFARVQRTCL